MSDESTPNAPAPEGEAPAAPPLRAVFLVWPGRVHGQTWMFLWLGVAYLIGALLPWHGPNEVEYVLAQPRQVSMSSQTEPSRHAATITAVEYKMAVENHYNFNEPPSHPGAITSTREPGMNFGRFLLLLCSLAMVVAGGLNIWNRKLGLTPTLCTWFIALAVLYFSSGLGYLPCDKDGYHRAPEVVKGFTQMGDTLGAVFGNFGDVISGKVTDDMSRVFDRFGMGYYVTMLGELFLILFIVYSIVTGMSSKKGAPAGAGGSGGGGSGGRRPRPGGGFPASKPEGGSGGADAS